MRARRSSVIGVVVASLAAVLVVSSPSLAKPTLHPEFHSCSDSIQKSFRLLNNLECASTNGLTVTASDITIDLGGHRISGNGSNNGIAIMSPVSGVTIKNGVIASFSIGVLLNGSNGNTIRNLLIERDTQQGIAIAASDKNKVSGNVFVANSGPAVLVASGGDQNTVTRNKFYGGVVGVSVNGTTNPGEEVKNNVISRNTVIGPSATGIVVGTGGDGNKVLSNTVLGASGVGINVAGGGTHTTVRKNVVRGDGEGVAFSTSPANTIDHNTITGSAGRAIDIQSSPNTVVTNNTVTANVAEGINVDAGSSAPTLTGNKAIENGLSGIAVASSDGVVKGNTARFNGFNRGITNPMAFGVVTVTPNASNNNAGGNASGVGAGDECNPSGACHDLNLLPPPLQTCGNVSQSITLHNPLDCPSGNGLTPTVSDLTLNLGLHRVSGATVDGSNAGVNAGALNNIAVIGGVLADSGNGVILGGTGESVTGSIIVGSTGAGIKNNSVSNSNFTNLTIDRTGNSADGILFINGSTNTVSHNTILPTNGGVDIIQNAPQNVVRNNTMAGGVFGVEASNASSANLPSGLGVASNKIFGTQNNGIILFNAPGATITKNVVQGSGKDAVGDGIRVDGNTINTAPGGSQNGTYTGNRVTASFHHGFAFLSLSSTNTLSRNVATANDFSGFFSGDTTSGNAFTKNTANEDGEDGFRIDTPATATANNDTADTNGFLAAPNVSDNDTGLGIAASGGTSGSGNIAKNNDDPNECQPQGLCA